MWSKKERQERLKRILNTGCQGVSKLLIKIFMGDRTIDANRTKSMERHNFEIDLSVWPQPYPHFYKEYKHEIS